MARRTPRRWWPVAPLAAALTLTAWHRTRSTTDSYAILLEAAIRLHTAKLARQLGIDHTGPLTSDAGAALTDLLHAQPSSGNDTADTLPPSPHTLTDPHPHPGIGR